MDRAATAGGGGVKFLLEIGVEEVPDWMLPPAMEHLSGKVADLVASLGGRVTLAEATPRRLAILVDRLKEREPDQTQVVKGPPVAAPQQAVEGFARKQGVSPQDLKQEGGYYQLSKTIAGRNAAEILAEKLPGVVLGIPWPKTMLWPGKGGARFIRPIRWIVALLGKDVIPFEINGVKSGDTTRGHRQLGKKKPLKVSIASYEKTLEKNGVILRASKRREKIVAEVGPGECPCRSARLPQRVAYGASRYLFAGLSLASRRSARDGDAPPPEVFRRSR
jgi:glycyl-tRNA synthetase beta chain